MRTVVIMCIGLLHAVPLLGQIRVEVVDGGSVATERVFGRGTNLSSTLTRTWIVLDDPAASIALDSAGVRLRYEERNLRFSPAGRVTAQQPVTAYEVRFLLYDVFNRWIATLTAVHVVDLQTGESVDMQAVGEWPIASVDSPRRFLNSIGFVAQVRYADGSVWRFDPAEILAAIEARGLEANVEDLLAEYEAASG